MPNLLPLDLLRYWTAGAPFATLLPPDHAGQCALLDACKDAVMDALDASDLPLAEQLVALMDAIAAYTNDGEHAALCHWASGILWLNRNARQALRHYQAAFSYYQTTGRRMEQGRVLIGLAAMQGQLGQLDAAVAAITTAATYLADYPAHHNRLPALLITRSDIEGRLGRYAEMAATAAEGARLAAQYGQSAAQAEALINQAFAALFLGQLPLARTLLLEAQTIATACGSRELLGRIGVNLARIATLQGDLFAALKLLDAARLDFAAAVIPHDEATVAIEEAALYERLHLPSEARAAATMAATMLAAVGMPNESLEAALIGIRLALQLGRLTEARHALSAAHTLVAAALVSPTFQALLDGYTAHPLLARTPAERAVALAQADTAAARLAAIPAPVEHLQVALLAAELAAALRHPDAADRYRQLAQATTGLPALEQQAQEGLATVTRGAQALAALARAAQLAAEVQQALPVEELKATAISGHAALFGRLVTAQLRSRQPLAAAQTLLAAKGSVWVEVAAPVVRNEPDPAWLRAATEVRYWREVQASTDDPLVQAQYATRVQQAETDLAHATRRIARARPPLPLPNIAAVQARLPEDALLVEYVVTDSRLRACVLTHTTGPRWLDLGAEAVVTALLGKLALLRGTLQRLPAVERATIATGQQAQTDALLAALADRLLAPLGDFAPGTRLLIAPDGPLFAVPWTALRYEGAYLGTQHELTLLPSGVVCALPLLPPVTIAPPLALGYVGDPPLSQVELELAAIAQLFPEARCCMPAQVADLIWDTPPALLHLAAHAFIAPQAPLLSGVALADGRLLLAEALNLSLHGTKLVTLSACDTGVAPERGGIALALAGAFLLAGAQTVVASLWPVDDQATALLMAQLYKGLHAGLAPAAALRQAQAAVRDSGIIHPYYWAAFQPLTRVVQ